MFLLQLPLAAMVHVYLKGGLMQCLFSTGQCGKKKRDKRVEMNSREYQGDKNGSAMQSR